MYQHHRSALSVTENMAGSQEQGPVMLENQSGGYQRGGHRVLVLRSAQCSPQQCWTGGAAP